MTIDIRGSEAEKALKKIQNRLEEINPGDAFQMVGDNNDVLIMLKQYLQEQCIDYKEAHIETEWILAFIK